MNSKIARHAAARVGVAAGGGDDEHRAARAGDDPLNEPVRHRRGIAALLAEDREVHPAAADDRAVDDVHVLRAVDRPEARGHPGPGAGGLEAGARRARRLRHRGRVAPPEEAPAEHGTLREQARDARAVPAREGEGDAGAPGGAGPGVAVDVQVPGFHAPTKSQRRLRGEAPICRTGEGCALVRHAPFGDDAGPMRTGALERSPEGA